MRYNKETFSKDKQHFSANKNKSKIVFSSKSYKNGRKGCDRHV